MKYHQKFLALILAVSLLMACEETPQVPTLDIAQLKVEFKNPPNEARPRVWWHWMNGNVTKEGIRKDLEWMNRSGIAGFQNFDANLFTPLVVENKLVFMEPDWKDAFKFTTELADSLGFEMAIAGSPGWSVTGGPWVEARDGMKKYVWAEKTVISSDTFDGKLPEVPNTTGPFHNVPAEGGIEMSGEHLELPVYYNDAAIFAYRLPEGEQELRELKPRVSSSGGRFSLQALTDGDLLTATELPPARVGEEIWIQYSFENPQTFRSYSVVGANHNPLEQFRGSPNNRRLYVSDDGTKFTKIADIPGSLVPQTSGSFPEATARHWRFAYETLPPAPAGIAAMFGAPAPTEPDGVPVAEFVLYQADRIHQFENKGGFSAWVEQDIPEGKATNPIPAEAVIDLTDKVSEDGSLEWEVPEGSWKLVRFGYSLTGRQNHPASPEATGLEVDKLDEDAVRRYINTYLDMYADATGGKLGPEGLGYIILDSYEAGHMNWTHDMFGEFQARRGYDMKPWLPVLTGRIVKSLADSEKFLWDFRKTIGEMIADNHYDIIGEELKKRNMGRYTESHEGGRIYLADGMDVKRHADVPMSAMWTPGSLAGGGDEETRSKADIRESASVANIYGQNVLAAESMTAIQNSFIWYPGNLKRTADMEMASGLNRFVIHTSVHQPLDDKMPGFTLGPFGQYFSRQETWADEARPWIDYLARSSHMFQQGRNVADILYYYGENKNITSLNTESLPPIPKGYEFDFVNATALDEAIGVADGKLVTQSGNTYELLVLDESAKEMTLSALNRIEVLLDEGARASGTLPALSPSLSDDPEAVRVAIDAIAQHPNWLPGSIQDALGQLGISPDITIDSNSEIVYRHRSAPGTEIYWLNNRSGSPTEAEVSFRVDGKVPELWDPQTGEVNPVSYRIADGRTLVSLDLESWGAVFVVLSGKAEANSLEIPRASESPVLTLEGPWDLSFEENRGAPASLVLENLQSWHEHQDPGVKYFSGTATYATTFTAPELTEGESFQLDLGEVHNIARVSLNGEEVGILWKAPYKINLGEKVKTGENQLEIAVTNTWVNRLIGDAQLGVTEKITYTTMPFYQANSQLLPAGLLGEVRLLKQSGR